MINEDYVSFKIAKLLKEKGFDERCTHYYKNEKYLVDLGYSNIHSYTNSDLVEEFVAPTLQMAMKWLREKYKLYVDVNFIEYQNNSKWCYKIVPMDESHISYNNCTGDSYEQSCEEAIKYCLENLI